MVGEDLLGEVGKAIKIDGGHFQQITEKERDKTMKIAVAATQSGHISQHFGRSAGFMIFEYEDGMIISKEFRDKTKGCGDGGGDCHDHGHGHGHGHGKSHGWIGEIVGDCQALICGGMGAGAQNALASAGVQPYVIRGKMTPEEASNLLMKEELEFVEGGGCSHH